MKTNESNFSDCDKTVEIDIENEESQFYESKDINQQFDNVHNVNSSSYDDKCIEE